MEKNSNKINSNSTNKYSDQSPAEGIKNNYYVKNSVIIRSRYSKPDKTNKKMREKKIKKKKMRKKKILIIFFIKNILILLKKL